MAHKRVMRSKTLEYVAFWSEIAWVAGTTTFNIVSQGDTLEQAVESLAYSLQMNALWDQSNGDDPLTRRDSSTEPLDDFTDTSDCVTADFGLEKKGRRYTGTVTVEWDENEPGWEKGSGNKGKK